MRQCWPSLERSRICALATDPERAMSLVLVQASVGPALSAVGPSIAHSTDAIPHSVLSCPLPDFN